jgi:hypothetical protein
MFYVWGLVFFFFSETENKTCARPHQKAEEWAMWTRLGGAVILFTGLISTLTQAVWFQGSPLIGVAFFDCVIGVVGIFSSSFMTKRAGILYLVLTLVRLVVALAMFSAFLGTFDAKTHLSHVLCRVIEGFVLVFFVVLRKSGVCHRK